MSGSQTGGLSRGDGTDTSSDQARALAAAWATRVRANREQVDAIREVADPADFYGPVTAHFRDDPGRTGDPTLNTLLGQARPDDVWLDIGAGAGRFALPIALRVHEVIALDPSAGMLAALREGMAASGIDNVRIVHGRWPDEVPEELTRDPADVAMMAHVGYDIEDISAFLDAMELAARRSCVAVMMNRQPSSIADVCWPPVHGMERISLPSLPALVELLRARGADAEVTRVPREHRRFDSREALEAFIRRQLWIGDGGEKDARFRRAVGELVVEEDGHFALRDEHPSEAGVVVWSPQRARVAG